MVERFTDIVVPLDHEWITKYRMPVIHGFSSRWYYPVTVAIPSDEEYLHDDLVMPTTEEVALLSSYAYYRLTRWFYPHYIENVIRKDILDIDSGVNTQHFGKSDRVGWRYKAMTWQHPAIPFPYAKDEKRKFLNLIDLILYIEKPSSVSDYVNPKWVAWQEENVALIEAANKSNTLVLVTE